MIQSSSFMIKSPEVLPIKNFTHPLLDLLNPKLWMGWAGVVRSQNSLFPKNITDSLWCASWNGDDWLTIFFPDKDVFCCSSDNYRATFSFIAGSRFLPYHVQTPGCPGTITGLCLQCDLMPTSRTKGGGF